MNLPTWRPSVSRLVNGIAPLTLGASVKERWRSPSSAAVTSSLRPTPKSHRALEVTRSPASRLRDYVFGKSGVVGLSSMS